MVDLKAAGVNHIPHIILLESSSYPPDEAATAEKIEYRLKYANPFFLVCENDGQLVGFINGTLTKEESLTHHSMSHHDSDGSLLCIHSVVVEHSRRKQGIGSKMLRSYIDHVKKIPSVNTIELLCKQNLQRFYENAGFTCLGPSPVEHGAEVWLSMRLNLR